MDLGSMLNAPSPGARASQAGPSQESASSQAGPSQGSASAMQGRFPGEPSGSGSSQNRLSRVTLPVLIQISDGEKSAAWLASKRRDDATANASARVVPRVVPLLIRLGSGESFDRARDLVNAWTEDGTRTRLAAEPLETCIDSVLGQGFREDGSRPRVSGRTCVTSLAQDNANYRTFYQQHWLGALRTASSHLDDAVHGSRWRNSSNPPDDQPVTQTLTLHFGGNMGNKQLTIDAAVCKTVQDLEAARQYITSRSNPYVSRDVSSTISRQADPGVGSSRQGGLQHANDYVQAQPRQREPQFPQSSQRSAPTSMGYNTLANPNAGFVTPTMQADPGVGSSRQGHLQYGSDYAQAQPRHQEPQFLQSSQQSSPTSTGYNPLPNLSAGFIRPALPSSQDSDDDNDDDDDDDLTPVAGRPVEPAPQVRRSVSLPLLLSVHRRIELVDQQSFNTANELLALWRNSQPRGGRSLIDDLLLQSSILSVLGDDPAVRNSLMTGQTQREIRGEIEEAQYQSDPSAFIKSFQFRPFYAALGQASSDLNDFIGNSPSANDNAARQYLTLRYDRRPDMHLTVNVDVCTTSEQLAHAAREVIGEGGANQGGGSAGAGFMDVVMD